MICLELNSIAFIPDGNRRYAKLGGINLLQSYQLGTNKAHEVIDWLLKYPQIKVGTFYTLSLENMNRTKLELHALFKIFERELNKVSEGSSFDVNEIRLKFIGRRNMFPQKLQDKMADAEKFTENFSNKTINLALGYNGQAEIVDAAKKLAIDAKENKVDLDSVNEKNFGKYLYGDFPSPDLLIRTSGTQRLSGFLTYQSAYSELYFLDKYWPEMNEADLTTAVRDYYERQRRFGK